MQLRDLPDLGSFHKSSFSGGGGCAEVARTPDGSVVVRDTKDPLREVALVFNRAEWTAFVLGVKNGEFEP